MFFMTVKLLSTLWLNSIFSLWICDKTYRYEENATTGVGEYNILI